MSNYTEQQLKDNAKIFKKDLDTLFFWIAPDGGPQQALELRKNIKTAIDTGKYVSGDSSAVGAIVNSKNFNVPAFYLGGKIMEERGAKLILRMRSYYQYLKEYEKHQTKKDAKDPVKKAKSKSEKKALKQIEKIKKRSNQTIFKSPSDIANDFAARADESFVSAMYNFETRWENNNQKVGNVFTGQYKDLKKDFNKALDEMTSDYKKISRYYNLYATKYGFKDLVSESIDCLIKRTPLNVVKEAFEEAQKEIDDFLKDANTVATESFKIADQSIGIVEELYDSTRQMQKEYKDYKTSIKKGKYATSKDSARNKFRQKFLKVLLPVLTSQVSKVLQTVLENVCNDDDPASVAIPSLVDEESLRNQLNASFGLNKDTSDDWLAMLGDVSGFLTPREICQLFNGAASDYVLNSVLYFNSVFYKKIFLQLSTKQRVAAFFVSVGRLVNPEFCRKIELDSLGDDYCFDPDSYASRLRACVLEENPDLLEQLRGNYIQTKKEQIKSALEFSFYPMDMRGDTQALNDIFLSDEKKQILDPLLEIASEYEQAYMEALTNMPSVFTKNYQVVEEKRDFLASVLSQVDPKLIPKDFKKQFDQAPLTMTRFGKQILPEFVPALFLKNSGLKFPVSADAGPGKRDFYQISKYYNTQDNSSGNFQKTMSELRHLKNAGSGIDINEKEVAFEETLGVPYYSKDIQLRYSDILMGYDRSREEYVGNRRSQLIIGEKSSLVIPGRFGLGSEFWVPVNNKKINLKYVTDDFSPEMAGSPGRTTAMMSIFSKYLKKIVAPSQVGGSDTFFLPVNKKGKNTIEMTYHRELVTTYNQLANICTNSVFARKIPLGMGSLNDNGNISGLDVVKLFPPNVDPDCTDKINFNLIDFKNVARQVAELDILEFNPQAIDEEGERELFLNMLFKFKSQVLDFMTKSIFLFSEFSFEKGDVDETMIDFVYLQLFQSLIREDEQLNSPSLKYEELSKEEKENFLQNIKFSELEEDKFEILKNRIAEGEKELEKYEKEAARLEYAGTGRRGERLMGLSSEYAIYKDTKEKLKNCITNLSQLENDPRGRLKWEPKWDYSKCAEAGEGSGREEGENAVKRLLKYWNKIRIAIFHKTKAVPAMTHDINFLKDFLARQQEETSFSEQNINITYEITRILLFYYNKVVDPAHPTKSFCEAIRRLIRHEISDMSKALKDVIYTPQQRDGKIFNIEDRMIEKKLNIFSSDQSIEKDIPDQVADMLGNMMSYDYPYFETAKNGDSFVDNHLKNIVESQIGDNYFLLTKVKPFSPEQKTTKVDIYCCFEEGWSKRDWQGEVKLKEKDFIKKLYKGARFLPSEEKWDKIDHDKQADRLIYAMEGAGTYENIIYEILNNSAYDKNSRRHPQDIVKIEEVFNARVQQRDDVEDWVDLSSSLEDELSGDELEKAQDMLNAARNHVNSEGGIRGNSWLFIPWADSKGKKTSAWWANGRYPFTPLYQYFRKDNDWEVADYKHTRLKGAAGQVAPVPNGQKTKHSLVYHTSKRNLGLLPQYRRWITPEAVSYITNFKDKNVYYIKKPIVTFEIDVSNYKAFVKNFHKRHSAPGKCTDLLVEFLTMPSSQQKKEWAKSWATFLDGRWQTLCGGHGEASAEASKNIFRRGYYNTMDNYINMCLKETIIQKAKEKLFPSELYSVSFPIHKLLSHISINLNLYTEYINNIGAGVGDSLKPSPVSTVGALDKYSFFNNRALLGSLGGAALGMTASKARSIKLGNQNLSAGDIIQQTQSIDFTIYYIKTLIKNYLSIIEQSDMNIRVSKAQADGISRVLRKVYAKMRLIANSADKIAKVFGAETPGGGIPSPAQLDAKFAGMRYLFNLPVTPFAIANLWGGLMPSNLMNWVFYVILEPILIAIQLGEDADLAELLKDLLFGSDSNNSLAAPGFNYEEACKAAKREALNENPVELFSQKTLGGEYLYPDGRDYVGYYHEHKDGTVMSGPAMNEDKKSFELTRKLKRDDL